MAIFFNSFASSNLLSPMATPPSAPSELALKSSTLFQGSRSTEIGRVGQGPAIWCQFGTVRIDSIRIEVLRDDQLRKVSE
jgi:hypothetical protein